MPGGLLSIRDLVVLGCSSQQPTRMRNHGAYLIRWNNKGFLIDPGEGTQRQFIFAEIAPTVVTHILVSHFHGDHCLGLGSMLMRLNLDKVPHPVHCYYPASGKKNFDSLRYGCIYHQTITIVEHPISSPGIVESEAGFKIEAEFLEHGIDNVGWRITEADRIKFDKALLKKFKIDGPPVKELEKKGYLTLPGRTVKLEEVSYLKKGLVVAYISDTIPCKEALLLAKEADLLISESTYLDSDRDLAKLYLHMTAKDAATIAKKAGAKKLLLTHFSARYRDTSLFEKEAQEIFPNSIAAEDLKRIEF